MNEPFCQPFGNRRLMHCINNTITATPHPPSNKPPSNRPPNSHVIPDPDVPVPNISAWESCGRIVPKERADFFEFVGCNLIFALVALGILFIRMKRVRMSQARWLAARIGVGGGGRNMGRWREADLLFRSFRSLSGWLLFGLGHKCKLSDRDIAYGLANIFLLPPVFQCRFPS